MKNFFFVLMSLLFSFSLFNGITYAEESPGTSRPFPQDNNKFPPPVNPSGPIIIHENEETPQPMPPIDDMPNEDISDPYSAKLVSVKWEYKGYALFDVHSGLSWGYRDSITISSERSITVGLQGYGISTSIGISYGIGETKNTRRNYLSALGSFGELWVGDKTYNMYDKIGRYIKTYNIKSLEAWYVVTLPVYSDSNGWLWYDWPPDGQWYWAYNLNNGTLEYAPLSKWRTY